MTHPRFSRIVLLVCVISLVVLGLSHRPVTLAAPTAQADVQRAWQRAQQVGTYHFTSEIVQTTYPAPALANVGRSSTQKTLYLEGETDLPAQVMQMRLWTQGGSVLTARDGVELRVAEGRGYGRVIGQTAWEELDEAVDAFAPNSDWLAYMAGAQNVAALGTETRAGVTFDRYRFDVDGPGFAAYMRDQMERRLQARGDLPAGMTLELADQYLGMTGEGELWVDGDQLPLRLSVHLVYPEQPTGERIEVQIQTDFSDYAREALAATPLNDPVTWATTTFGLPRTPAAWLATAQQFSLVLITVSLLMLLVLYSRARFTYALTVGLVLVSMLVTPLLRAQQVAAFSERQTVQRTEQQAEADAARAEQEQSAALAWNPHIDPLAAPASLPDVGYGDTRADSAPAAPAPSLAALFTTDTPLASDGDEDGDGLTNAQEAFLGTNSRAVDSDSDGITDNAEVHGFVYWGKTWYINSLSGDSDGDGRADSLECPQRLRADAHSLSPEGVCQDTDGDGTPDIFDRDSDADGVPDSLDVSPRGQMGSAATPFSRSNPFNLIVDKLQAGLPALVDIQLRPANPVHLAYALNVLDWPSGDEDGQIQRRKGNDSTFASALGLTAAQTQADPRSLNGDMRLLPMLEVELTGANIPLPLTTPQTTVQLNDNRGSVDFQQVGADIRMTFHWSLGAPDYAMTIYNHSCAELDRLLAPPLIATEPNPPPQVLYTNSAAHGTVTLDRARLTDVADGAHAIQIAIGPAVMGCTTIGNLVNGPYRDRMVDTKLLQDYSMIVREKDQAGNLLAYVPLNVVPDETGGGKTAFGARLYYQPSAGSWGNAQPLRVVWMVQALTDSCRPMPADYKPAGVKPEEYQAKWCADPNHWDADKAQIVQTYDEEWFLTGLSVREDHGMAVAVAFEDPVTDADAGQDDALWRLANGLEFTFLAGRVQDPLTVAEIQRRFDRLGNAGVAEEQRWGIPANALRVLTYHFPTQDYLATFATTRTQQILTDYFSLKVGEQWQPRPGVEAPTLLFAREERARTANLDDAATNRPNGKGVTLSVTGDAVALVGMNWAPFRFYGGQWQAYPLDKYLERLGGLLQTHFAQLAEFNDPTAPDAPRIAAQVGQAYYAACNRGTAQIVQLGARMLESSVSVMSDATIHAYVNQALGAGGTPRMIVSQIAGPLVKLILEKSAASAAAAVAGGAPIIKTTLSFAQQLQKAWDWLKDTSQSAWAWLKDAPQGLLQFIQSFDLWGFICQHKSYVAIGLGVMAIGAMVTALSIGITCIGGFNFMTVVNLTGAIMNAGFATYNFIKTLVEQIKIAAGLLEGPSALVRSAGAIGAVIGLIVGAAVSIVVFAVTMATYQVPAFSVEFNSMLAGVIAGIILSVLMFAFSLIPYVGPIVVAFIGMIDGLIGAVCTAISAATGKPWDLALELPNFRLSFCGGLNGLATEAVKWTIYSNNVMVTLNDPNRLVFMDIQKTMAAPDKGMTPGQRVTISPVFKNRVALTMPKDWKALAYSWQYNEATLRQTTFNYALVPVTTTVKLQSFVTNTLTGTLTVKKPVTVPLNLHDDLVMGSIAAAWKSDGPSGAVFVYYPYYVALVPKLSQTITLTTPGLNRSFALYLAEGYVAPQQECWLIPSIGPIPAFPICYIRSVRDTSFMDLGQSLKLDVFPATLDEFYTLTPTGGGGYALAWGYDPTSKLSFRRLKDADGDGLLNPVDGGSDPDDTRWDTDGDGVSDLFELQYGNSPLVVDADSDGLVDADETRLGTNLYQADSDRDGLSDKQEVEGWEVVYGLDANGQPRWTRVTSNPLNRDTDGDGFMDIAEKTMGFNPRVFTDPNFMAFTTDIIEQSSPRALWSLDETSGATTFTEALQRFPLTCTADACPAPGVAGRYGNAVAFDGVDDALSSDLVSSVTDNLTFAAWVKQTSRPAGGQLIFYNGDPSTSGYGFYVTPAGQVAILLGGVIEAPTGYTLPLQTWVHLTALRQNGVWQLYVNGAPSNLSVTNAAPNPPTGQTRLGGFAGFIDEVAFFTRALPEGEIQPLTQAVYNLADGLVKPGDALQYRATVENRMINRNIQGGMMAEFPATVTGVASPVAFELWPGETQTLVGDVQITGAAASGVISMAQVAGGHLADPRAANPIELWLRMDELAGATRFLDESNPFRANTATCTGATCPATGTTGKFGLAARFDGVNDHIQVAKTPTLQFTDATFSAWFKAEPDRSGYHVLLSDEGATGGQVEISYRLIILLDGTLRFDFLTDAGWAFFTTGMVVDDVQWHHVVVVRNDAAKTGVVYVDGVERVRQSYGGVIDNNLNPVWVGGSPLSGGIYPFKGWIDEVRLYARALSPTDAQSLYTYPIFKSGFNAYKKAADESVITWSDDSGWGNYPTSLEDTGIAPLIPGVSGAGRALSVRDRNSFATVGPSPVLALGNQFAFSVWIKAYQTPTDRQGILGNRDFNCTANAASFPRLEIQANDVIVSYYDTTCAWQSVRFANVVTYPDPWTWVHLALSVNGSAATLYVNAQTPTTLTLPGGGVHPTGPNPTFAIGSLPPAGAPASDLGNVGIDELGIYNGVFSAADVSTLYANVAVDTHMAFDDPPGATRFQTNGAYNPRCADTACPRITRGLLNEAAQFDGVNDTFELTVTIPVNALTFSLWFKTDCVNCGLVSTDPRPGDLTTGRQIYLRDGDVCVRFDGSDYCSTGHNWADGNWHHLWQTLGTTVVLDNQSIGEFIPYISDPYAWVAVINVGYAAAAEHPYFRGLLDEMWFIDGRSEKEHYSMYQAAPSTLFHLDDFMGVTQFRDERGRTGVCSGVACPAAGAKGQLGLSASFNGQSVIEVQTDPAATFNYSFLAWIQWSGAQCQTLFQQGAATAQKYFRVDICPDRVVVFDSQYTKEFAAQFPLNAWQHLAVVHGGRASGSSTQWTVYLNGAEAVRLDQNPEGPSAWPMNGLTAIGGGIAANGVAYPSFEGRIDEVALYDGGALSAADVQQLYVSQVRWVEERQSIGLVIDAEPPTSVLRSAQAYRPNQDVVLDIGASDATGGVARVELSVNGVWRDIPPCRDAVGGVGDSAWCPTFIPAGEGRYLLQTRAIDRAGHVETPAQTTTFYVDGTAPFITPTLPSGSLLNLAPHPTLVNAWTLTLSGAVADPPLSDGAPGSGVVDVEVTLATADGTPAGLGRQAATIAGNLWTVAYLFDAAQPTGQYTLTVEATDAVGNARVSPAIAFAVDATPPAVYLNAAALPTTTLTATATLAGLVSEMPRLSGAVLHLPFEETSGTTFADASNTLNHGMCAGASCPVAGVPGQWGNAVQFDGLDDFVDAGSGPSIAGTGPFAVTAWINTSSPTRQVILQQRSAAVYNGEFMLTVEADGKVEWFTYGDDAEGFKVRSAHAVADGQWHHIAAVRESDGTGRIYVDGALDAWADAPARTLVNTTIYIGADMRENALFWHGRLDDVRVFNRALSASDIAWLAQERFSGVQQADVAFTPTAPGSGFYNEPPLAGQVLYLPLDDQANAGGNLSLKDVAGMSSGGSCTGDACPTTGEPGHTGSAVYFDGVNDFVSVPDAESLRLATFSVGGWVKPERVSGDWQALIVKGNPWGHYRNYGLWLIPNTLTLDFGFKGGFDCATYYTYASAGALQLNAWNFVWLTYDGASLKLYLNGQLDREVAVGVAACQGADPLQIGRLAAGYASFQGALDDLRVLNRALSAAEVWSLYLGSGPLLHLTLDEPAAQNNTRLADSSGQARDGLLLTGATDVVNKTGLGQVGSGALTFDGVDDYAQIPYQPELDFGAAQDFSVALWAKLSGPNAWAALFGNKDWNAYTNPGFTLALWSDGSQWVANVGDGVNRQELWGPAIKDGQWHHLAATFDRDGGAAIYQDGVLLTTASLSTIGNINNGLPWVMGTDATHQYPYQGALDDARVYGRVLTAGEIAELYHAGWQTVALAASGAGVGMTSWTVPLPAGLEGAYQIDFRGQDMLGNLARGYDNAALWNGVIDTLPPRLTLTREYLGVAGTSTARTRFTLTAQDYHLTEAGLSFQPPCAAQRVADRQFYQSPWYLALTGQSAQSRLYAFTVECEVAGFSAAETVTVCDAAGNCATQSATARRIPAAPAGAGLSVAILTPVQQTFLSQTTPISITGGVYAPDSVKALTVTVDAQVLYTQTWAAGALTTTAWATSWTPTGEGDHVFQATLADWTSGITTTPALTVVLDTQTPAFTLAQTVFTGTHYSSIGVLGLTGIVTDASAVQVEVQVDGAPLPGVAVVGNRALASWPVGYGSAADGVTHTVAITATDAGGNQTRVTQTVTVDLVPPSPVTLTLTSAGQVITPGVTLREISPTLTLTWTASADGGGLAPYQLTWITQKTSGVTATTFITTARQVSQVAGEAQQITLRLAIRDVHGNQTVQEYGPVYVDTPLSPDYAPVLPPLSVPSIGGEAGDVYQDWMASACSQLGVDTRIRDKATEDAALSAAQEFFTTWDETAMRLAWTGADWDEDGYLFIYLDTRDGGSNAVYDPDADDISTAILLPVRQQGDRQTGTTKTPMLADYAIWVTDREEAFLLEWNDTDEAWYEADTTDALTYTFTTDAARGYATNLSLPFSALGIDDPAGTPLSLVAFASEWDALSLWAAMPPRNPVNSERVLDRIPPGNLQQFILTQAYEWPSLGSGVCPNGAQSVIAKFRSPGLRPSAPQPEDLFSAADVRLSMEAAPGGYAYSVLADDNFFLMDDLDAFDDLADWDMLDDAYCLANPDDPECERQPVGKPLEPGGAPTGELDGNLAALNQLDDLADADYPAVGAGQWITYTIRYVNEGTETATGLVADISTVGPLVLPAGETYTDTDGSEYYNLELPLGDLEPGEMLTATFVGQIDLTFDPLNDDGWASVEVVFYDDSGSYYDDQLDWFYVDHEVDSEPPDVVITDLPALLSPGANLIHGLALDQSPVPTLTLQLDAQSIVCVNPTPEGETWACPLDLGAAPEGSVRQLRARGVDVFGQTGDWTDWIAFTVDGTPPTTTLSALTLGALSDGILGTNETLLTGVNRDNRLADAVMVCDAAGLCVPATLRLDAGALPAPRIYDDIAAAPIPIDAAADCETGEPIIRTFEVTESFTIGEIAVGLNLSHTFRYDLGVELYAPSGEVVEILWNGTEAENYDVLLYDRAKTANWDDEDDHLLDAPYYKNERRPDDPLGFFRGEDAEGTWELVICDDAPEADDGAYFRSRLILTPDALPQDTRAAWGYQLPDVAGVDNVIRTLAFYGLDSVGNRTAPVTLTFRVDTQPPVLTVSTVITQAAQALTTTVLFGSVSDGSEVADVWVSGYTPQGNAFTGRAARDGAGWRYDLVPAESGLYTLWVSASDEAGNQATLGAYQTLVIAAPQPPNTPALLAPANGTITTTRAVRLRWASDPGSAAPDSYSLEVDGVVITTTGTTWATTLELGDHTWRVRAFDAVGYSDWSAPWTLRVVALLCVPLGGVQVTGQPTVTLNSTATFVATVTPISHTQQLLPSLPLTYTWTASDLAAQSHVITVEGTLTDTAGFVWSVEGLKNVTVTVANPCGVIVNDANAITVVAESETVQHIYLPLVMRNF